MRLKKFLSILIIGILVFLVGCTTENTTISTTDNSDNYNYSDYSYYQINSFSEQLNRLDTDYYVYYYSESCPSCATIKDDVLSRVANLVEDNLFLFDVYRDIDVEPSFNLDYVPTLVYVVDNQYSEKYVGPEEIIPILETLE
ncbi:MAG: thioredoxin domain-containing protein [Bacillota bacterium]